MLRQGQAALDRRALALLIGAVAHKSGAAKSNPPSGS
jgi:hypothetical protein